MRVFYKKLTILMVLVYGLTGCSITYPAVGSVEGTGENFSGTAVTSSFSGELSMSTDKGVTCSGSYTPPQVASFSQIVSFSGNLICSDGRIGSWTATGNIADGFKGIGKVDGRKFSFYGGNAIPGS